jgi:hypothetical protein
VVSGANSAVANTRNTVMEPYGPALSGFAYCSQGKEAYFVEEHGGIIEFPLAAPLSLVDSSNKWTPPVLTRIK